MCKELTDEELRRLVYVMALEFPLVPYDGDKIRRVVQTVFPDTPDYSVQWFEQRIAYANYSLGGLHVYHPAIAWTWWADPSMRRVHARVMAATRKWQREHG